MELGSDNIVRPIETNNWIEIQEWCARYNRFNRYPVNIINRYAIGIYQIHQGMEWSDLLNKAESFMSAFLHFEMVGDLLQTTHCNPFIDTIPTRPLQSERVLYLISKVQQQIFYSRKVNNTKRASRYNKPLTSKLLTELQLNLIGLVPSYLRSTGVYHASKIMTGVL